MSAARITVDDVRRAGYCARGIKAWLDAKGIDFREFLANGIAADDERIAGDAHTTRVLALMRGRG